MSVRCMTYRSTYLHLLQRARSTMSHIGPSMTENDLIMKFTLQQGMYFQHPCRVNWTKKIRIIAPCPTKNDVNFCPPLRQKLTESELWIKPKDLRPLRQLRPRMVAIHLQRLQVRIKQWMVSYQPEIIRVRNSPKNKGSQRYCMLCKKAGIPERKYKMHSSENCFGKFLNRNPSRKAWWGY